MNKIIPNNSRCSSIDELLVTTIAAFLSPPPKRATVRRWFKDAGIPHFKANPLATKGGGPVYYSVSHVEKFFAARTGKGAI